MSTATTPSVAMDGYGQSLLGHNYYSFNLLHPSYHDEQSFNVDCDLDDGFGFDPSPTGQTVLDQYSSTADLITAKPYPTPFQLSPASLLWHKSDHTQLPTGQSHALHVPGLTSGARRTSAEPDYGAKVETETSTSIGTVANRSLDKVHPVEATVPPKIHNGSAKPGRRRAHQSCSTTKSYQNSLRVDKRKQLSLEKNKLAASKCRIKKKEKNEQMLQESRTKAKENQVLRNLARTMEMELQRLRTFLSAHSDSSNCQKREELKEALRILHEADPSKRCSGSPGAECPALSLSEKSPSDDSYGRSPATPAPPSTQTLDSYLSYVKDDSPLFAYDSEG